MKGVLIGKYWFLTALFIRRYSANFLNIDHVTSSCETCELHNIKTFEAQTVNIPTTRLG
jgi:hypothetical protein